MHRTPCEYMIWNRIPAIRKELAEALIKEFGLSQREKRGKTDVFDEAIIQEISVSAQRIMKNDGTDAIVETCRICRLVQKKLTFPMDFR